MIDPRIAGLPWPPFGWRHVKAGMRPALAAWQAFAGRLAAAEALPDAPGRMAALAELRANVGEPIRAHALRALEAAQLAQRGRSVADWSDLLLFCRYAAAPWGQVALEACGETDPAARSAMEALAAALWIVREAGGARQETALRLLPAAWLADAPTRMIESARALNRLTPEFAPLALRLRDSGLLAEVRAAESVAAWAGACLAAAPARPLNLAPFARLRVLAPARLRLAIGA